MPKRDPIHMSAQRERIVRATIGCIADKGVERTSITDICRKAGMSVGAIYVHFANKQEIVAAALSYGSMEAVDLPGDWPSFKAMIANMDGQKGFDMVTVVRNRLNLHAECVRPGELHDLFRPILAGLIDVLAAHLQKMADDGGIRLKMSARQTALSISAFIDGMLWIALASDRPLDELRSELSDGLDCFVDSVEQRSQLHQAPAC